MRCTSGLKSKGYVLPSLRSGRHLDTINHIQPHGVAYNRYDIDLLSSVYGHIFYTVKVGLLSPLRHYRSGSLFLLSMVSLKFLQHTNKSIWDICTCFLLLSRTPFHQRATWSIHSFSSGSTSIVTTSLIPFLTTLFKIATS